MEGEESNPEASEAGVGMDFAGIGYRSEVEVGFGFGFGFGRGM